MGKNSHSFEINDDNEVLVKLPSSKRFIGAPERHEKITEQKGDTCWYYSLRFLTPVFSEEASHHPDMVRVETELSTLINKLAQVHHNKELHKELFKLVGLSGIRKFSDTNDIRELVNAFDSQIEHTDFSKFIANFYHQKELSLLKNGLNRLGINPEDKLYEHQQLLKKVSGIEFSEEKAVDYNMLVSNLIFEKYHLLYSSWQPNQTFNHLLRAMKTYGALKVGGKFGSSYYKVKPEISRKTFGSKKICYWPKDSYNDSDDGYISHAIVLVGAKKMGSQELVFFIDPNDSSDDYDKVYCMSYKLLCQKVHSVDGISYKKYGQNTGVVNRPYTIAANPLYVYECEAEYIADNDPISIKKLDALLVELERISVELDKKEHRGEGQALTDYIPNLLKDFRRFKIDLLMAEEEAYRDVIDEYHLHVKLSVQQISSKLAKQTRCLPILKECELALKMCSLHFALQYGEDIDESHRSNANMLESHLDYLQGIRLLDESLDDGERINITSKLIVDKEKLNEGITKLIQASDQLPDSLETLKVNSQKRLLVLAQQLKQAGNRLFELGSYDEAEYAYSQALKIQRLINPMDVRLTINILSNLAVTYNKLTRFEQTIDVTSQGITLCNLLNSSIENKRFLKKLTFNMQTALKEMANQCFKESAFSKSKKYFEKALSHQFDNSYKGQLLHINILSNLVITCRQLNENKQASDYGLRGIEACELLDNDETLDKLLKKLKFNTALALLDTAKDKGEGEAFEVIGKVKAIIKDSGLPEARMLAIENRISRLQSQYKENAGSTCILS